MNERILELALQAKIEFTVDPTETPMRAFAECWEDELEKFAELLIRECANALDEMHQWQSINNQNYPSVWHDAVDQSIFQIKKHFGVEE